MNPIKTITAAVLVSAAGCVFAAQPTTTDTTRQERMDQALNDYRDAHPSSSTSMSNPNPGPAERGENAIKRGVHKTGNAIERGAKAVGHAVGTGLSKTGEALHNGGTKLQDKTEK
jgi:hypothetical protein